MLKYSSHIQSLPLNNNNSMQTRQKLLDATKDMEKVKVVNLLLIIITNYKL